MKEGAVSDLKKELGNLGQPPHVMAQFIDLLANQRPLRFAEQEERWKHLASCHECQIFLGTYLVERIKDDKARGIPTETPKELLSRLTPVIESSHEDLKKDIPAYVDALEEGSKEKARKKFPQLSEHVKHCTNCQETVKALREWIHHLKEANLV